MTGTAKTEEEEFQKIYSLDCVVIPTNKPIQGFDEQDLVYKTERGKFKSCAAEIKERHAKGQPILVGTTSVEKIRDSPPTLAGRRRTTRSTQRKASL